MNSILLKTLAAASLVAAAEAQVSVLGTVWKERGLTAPTGTIDPNPGTVAAIRSYMIFDSTLFTTAPAAGTLIEYRDARQGGVMSRTYTINGAFRAFNGDLISGDSGGRRIYGSIYAPRTIANGNGTGTTMPYSGTVLADGFPKHLKFDNTVFQFGTATGLATPQIVDVGSSLQRTVLSGSANKINVEATTIAGATAELEARLAKSGYTRAATVPVITTDLPLTLQINEGSTQVLSVGLTNAFPTPTYQWFKDNVAIPAGSGGTSPTFTVNGVASSATNGLGVYRVEVSTTAGTAVSGNSTVTAQQFTFATNLPATTTVIGANSINLSVVLSPTPIVTPTYRWFKGAAQVPDSVGGNLPVLTVIGGEAATGAGTYRVEVTSWAGTTSSATTTLSVTAAGTNFCFTTNVPRTAKPLFSGTVTLSPVMNASAVPSSTSATRQWFKAPLANPTAFVAVPAGDGGTTNNLIVSGDNASPRGPGVYRLVVTSTVAPITTATSIDCVVTTGP
jgi:hypothetical protein